MKKFDAIKLIFWQNDSILNLAILLTILFLNKGFVSAQIVHTWGNQLVPELYWSLLILYIHHADTLNICIKKFDAKRFELSHFLTLLLKKDFVSAQIVHARGNQLVPELLLKPSDTLHAHCSHIEHLHEEVWCYKNTFWQNDTFWTYPFFFNTLLLNDGFVSAQIVHAHRNQLVLELLLKPSYTSHAQCRHIEHLHEEVWYHKVLFWQNYIVLFFYFLHFVF